MSSIEDAHRESVKKYMDGGPESDSAHISADVAKGLVSLLQVVLSLGPFLVSEDNVIRHRGLKLLSDVLHSAPDASFTIQAMRVLTDFYCDKLQDEDATLSVILGLTALTQHTSFTSQDAVQICKGLFENVHMSTHLQSTRYHVFRLIDSLMEKQRPALLSMGDDFITGYCSLANKEKDPRNLLLSFGISRVILLEFDISRSVKILFDVTFCYFPITFTPPPLDPYGISCNDLRIALRGCLSATPKFATDGIPLFVEKLAAATGSSKIDGLETFSVCCPVYGSQLKVFSRQIWEIIKVEVFYSSDEDVVKGCLGLLMAIMQTLYSDAATVSTAFLELVLKDCQLAILEPEKNRAIPAGMVLATCLKSLPQPRMQVLDKCLRPLLALVLATSDEIKKAAAYSIISQLFSALRDAYADNPNCFEAERDIFKSLQPDLGKAVESSMSNSKVTREALPGLISLCLIPTFFSKQDSTKALSFIQQLLLSGPEGKNSDYDTLSLVATAGLLLMARQSPDTIKENTLPFIFSKIPSSSDLLKNENVVRIRALLSILQQLCQTKELFTMFSEFVLDCLQTYNTSEGELVHARMFLILSTYHATLISKLDRQDQDLNDLHVNILPRFIQFFTVNAVQLHSYKEVNEIGTAIIGAIVSFLDIEKQQSIYEAASQNIFHGISCDLFPVCFENSCSAQKILDVKSFNPLWTSILVSLRPDVKLHSEDIDILSNTLSNIYSSIESMEKESMSLMCFSYLISSILHKHPNSLQFSYELFKPDLPEIPTQVAQILIKFISPITKALLMAKRVEGFELLQTILRCLNHPDLLDCAISSLEFITDEQDSILNVRNNFKQKILYRQKIFSVVLPALTTSSVIHTVGAEIGKQSRLICLSSILKNIPEQIMAAKITELFPFMLQSLGLASTSARTDTIQSILNMLSNQTILVPFISQHLSTVIKLLLISSTSQSTKLKISALLCLRQLPDHIENSSLQQYKLPVISGLSSALDDSRGTVRSTAVSCRSSWYKVNSVSNY